MSDTFTPTEKNTRSQYKYRADFEGNTLRSDSEAERQELRPIGTLELISAGYRWLKYKMDKDTNKGPEHLQNYGGGMVRAEYPFFPEITNKTTLIDRQGWEYGVALKDFELIRKREDNSVNQVVAHLSFTAPSHIENPKDVLSVPFVQMWYRPKLLDEGLDYEGESGVAMIPNLIFTDREKQPSVYKGKRYLSALVAVNEFRYIGEGLDIISNPMISAEPEDFVLQLNTQLPRVPGQGIHYARQFLGMKPSPSRLR